MPPNSRNDKLSFQILFLVGVEMSLKQHSYHRGILRWKKIVMKLSLEALGRVRPEFLSWISLRRYNILPHYTEMISPGNYLKTNETYSAVGGQN